MENNIIAHHGTVLERPLLPDSKHVSEAIIFSDILNNKNQFNAFFMSQNKSVCEFFSDIKLHDEENQIQAILNLKATCDRKLELEIFGQSYVEYNNSKFDYSNNDSRIKLFNSLKMDCVQMLVVKDNYFIEGDGGGDDIAVFDTSILECSSIDLRFNGEWKRNISPEKAKLLFLKWFDISNEEASNYNKNFA